MKSIVSSISSCLAVREEGWQNIVGKLQITIKWSKRTWVYNKSEIRKSDLVSRCRISRIHKSFVNPFQSSFNLVADFLLRFCHLHKSPQLISCQIKLKGWSKAIPSVISVIIPVTDKSCSQGPSLDSPSFDHFLTIKSYTFQFLLPFLLDLLALYAFNSRLVSFCTLFLCIDCAFSLD